MGHNSYLYCHYIAITVIVKAVIALAVIDPLLRRDMLLISAGSHTACLFDHERAIVVASQRE